MSDRENCPDCEEQAGVIVGLRNHLGFVLDREADTQRRHDATIEAQAAEIEKLRGALRQIEVDAVETYNDWCEAGCDAKDAIRFAFDIGTYCRAALGETK